MLGKYLKIRLLHGQKQVNCRGGIKKLLRGDYGVNPSHLRATDQSKIIKKKLYLYIIW